MNRPVMLSLSALLCLAALGGCSQRQEGAEPRPSAAADPNAPPTANAGGATASQTPTAPDMNMPSNIDPGSTSSQPTSQTQGASPGKAGAAGNAGPSAPSSGKTTDPQTTNQGSPPNR